MNLLSLLFFLMHFTSWSQKAETILLDNSPEKIYLQLDREVYATDNNIWFKSIVANAKYHTPTLLSGVLYIELIDPNEKLLEKKLIKLEKGVGSGFFKLNRNAIEGMYLVRAYTEWNKNFGADFYFKEYLRVFSPSAKKLTNAISNITLVEKEGNKRSLNAHFSPYDIDSLHKKRLTVIVSQKNKKDTLFIRKNKNDAFVLDYEIADSIQFVTLQMLTKNLQSESKTIALEEDYINLQFFPESGELVHGISSKVAFKAIDSNGKGKQVSGEIIDDKEKIITRFESNELGMGHFTLILADCSTSYRAKLATQESEKVSMEVLLPKISGLGNVLSVVNQGEKIRLVASSNYLKNDSIYIKASCRGRDYFDIRGQLRNGTLRFSLPSNKLPEGIIAFTMMDKPGHHVAERLFFNERPEQRIQVKLSTNRDTYYQRDLTELNIETTNNNGQFINADISVLAFNKDQLGELEDSRHHILSYFILTSDLKGTIENPAYYFGDNPNRKYHMDLLMLTQGWRKYHYHKTIDSIVHQPETALSVSGSVKRAVSTSNKKAVDLTLLTFGNPKSLQSQTTNDFGKFNFPLEDAYGDPMRILLQTKNKKNGKKRNYTIDLKENHSPPVNYDFQKSVEQVDSTIQLIVENNIERKLKEDSYRLASGITQLEEVVLKPYKMTPQRQKVADEYGKPTLVIEGKEIEEKEEKWSYGLYSVLMFNYPDKIDIVRRNQDLYAFVVGSPGITMVVIDGIPVMWYHYPLIHSIPPSEVKSFEIIKSAKNIFQLYMEVVPNASPLGAPTFGSVIAIYTRAGKGLHGAFKPIGIIKTSVPVFSESIEFYAPKYENPKEVDWLKPDLRSVIHWEPSLTLDSNGKVSTSFYNADTTGKMQIVVEAISDNGAMGYQVIDYEVEKI